MKIMSCNPTETIILNSNLFGLTKNKINMKYILVSVDASALAKKFL